MRRRLVSRALFRAFVPDIGEKLGLRDARERKSVSRREQSAGDDGSSGVGGVGVRGERSEEVVSETAREFLY